MTERARMEELVARLTATRRMMEAAPRPDARAMDSLSVWLASARQALASFDPARLAASDRAAAEHAVSSLRKELRVVARLVTGGTWFAALAHELAVGRPESVLYSRGGTPARAVPARLERRA